jgi:hypothetical protein
MRIIIENVIKKGGYDLTELLAKIDTFFAEGKLTADERNALYELARVKPKAQYDVKTEIEKLWVAVKALQNGSTTGGSATTEAKDYVQPTGAHDAYNKGDRVLFNGKVYASTIDGNVWSPLVYPNGWELV